MSNFAFLKEKKEYALFASAAIEAEKVYVSAPAMCAVGSRKALELAVKWVYSADNTMQMPYKDNLQALIHEPTFRFAVDYNTWGKLPFIIKLGNLAVHTERSVQASDALASLQGLFEFIQWVDYGGGTVYDAEKKAAEALLKAAKEKFRHTAPELLDGFCRKVDSLTAEVENAVSADCAVNPADIDTNALELLKSGIMGVRDYAAMVARYSGNKTMSRLIVKYANEARETIGAAGDRQNMAVIAMTASENAGDDVLDQWGGLVAAAKGYCGYRNAYSSSYVQTMQEHWNDGDIQALVENF